MTDVLQHICDWLENMAESKVYSINKMIEDKYGMGYCRWKEVGSWIVEKRYGVVGSIKSETV